MKQYLAVLEDCMNQGIRQKNRTGVDTFMIPGHMMKFDLDQGFPILTTKKINFDSVKGELLGFIRGYTNAADFRKLGCKIWDANANNNEAWLTNPNRKGVDDLGRIYGAQWRDWEVRHVDGGRDSIDQFGGAIEMILRDPTSRRIIVNAWRPDELKEMALPPCHLYYQFLVGQLERKLHMTMVMRSCDMFLGVPFNISSYALLLSIVAMATGLQPGVLSMFLSDVHIYENHVEQVKLQLARTPWLPPKLLIARTAPSYFHGGIAPLRWIETMEPEDIYLAEYQHHPAIKAEMAV